jgi:hypothetical protein
MILMDIGNGIDEGTLARERNNAPGPMSGPGNSNYVIPGPILVGKPPREPGKNEDGSVYEDMLFADDPPQAASIKQDPVYKLKDSELEEMGLALMKSVSTGELEKVAVEAWDRFCKGVGGTYSNTKLTEAVRDNDATKDFVNAFNARLRKAILDRKCDLNGFPPLPIGRYAFSSFNDKRTGLGILIHDIWSIKAELKNYNGTWDNIAQQGAFYGKIVYTLTDDFGLDWNDIVQHGSDHIPPTLSKWTTGDRFKAWYILQHYRKAKPFFIEIKLEYDIDDGAPRKF